MGGIPSKSVNEWTAEDVKSAVISIGSAFEGYAEALYQNGVDGDVIKGMTADDLDELGLNLKNIHRQRLIKELKKIQDHGDKTSVMQSNVPVKPHNPVDDNKILKDEISETASELSFDKFNTDMDYFIFGNGEDFKDGLTKRIKQLSRSMEEELTTNDKGRWAQDYDYVVNQPCVERSFGKYRVRDKGREGATLKTFCEHQKAVDAELTEAEVAALRLYTGPLYEPWNTALRLSSKDPTQLISWGTCISVLYNAIFKLSFLSKKGVVYRGVNESNRCLPESFVNPDGSGSSGGFAGGVELAFMSTSVDLDIALSYLKKGSTSVGSIFEIKFDAASRGSDVQWVSQYPEEAELLYPPCTYLTCESVRVEKGVRFLSVRATVSTARHDVGNIKTTLTIPDQDEAVARSYLDDPKANWQSGLHMLYGANGRFPRNFYAHFDPEIGKSLRSGDAVMFMNLPVLDEFNPNGIFFHIESENAGGTPHLANIGVEYSGKGLDSGSVRFLIKRKADITPDEAEAHLRLFHKRGAAQIARRKAEDEALASTAEKYFSGWHRGISNLYEANDCRSFYIHFDPGIPLLTIFPRGNYIMVRNLPVVSGVDLNNVWFSVDSPDECTPHFNNPGVPYRSSRSTDWASVFFVAKRADDMTPDDAKENLEKLEKVKRSASILPSVANSASETCTIM